MTPTTDAELYDLMKTKYVFPSKKPKKVNRIDNYGFRVHPFLRLRRGYDTNDVSIAVKTTPDTLLMIAANVVDNLPLPSPYYWTIVDVCRWIRQYGYPQYQRTFGENKINGRKLILLDAQALNAMNIKKFDQIKHIAYGIRCLFHFEMISYFRSLSLPPENWEDTYKLYRIKTGRKYDETRRTDLWHRMQLLRTQDIYLTHWDKLEDLFKVEKKKGEGFGGCRKNGFNRCISSNKSKKTEPILKRNYWQELAADPPTLLSILDEHQKVPAHANEKRCDLCLPPCTCHWPLKSRGSAVLSILKVEFPNRYGALFPKTSILSPSRIHFADSIVLYRSRNKNDIVNKIFSL